MENELDLSVIIRGGELNCWLDEAVTSVLASEGVFLEVVLILNGPKISLDHDRIAQEESMYPWLTDSRVKVFRFDHYLGMSGSIIEGMRHVNASIIANVDGDDVVLPQKFAQQLDYLRTHTDCVLVGTKAKMIDENDQIIGDLKGPAGDDIRKYLMLMNPIPHASVVFRKEAHDKIGGHRPGLDQCEDYDFTLRIACLGKVALLDEQLVLYRVHSSNLSKGASARGSHIEAVTQGRRALARTLGISPLIAWPQHALWRTVQFVRGAGLIRPLHEYSKNKS